MKALPRYLGVRVHSGRKQGSDQLLISSRGSDSTRSCNQTAMSGRITVRFVDFLAFSF
jgi:hypothetical protein